MNQELIAGWKRFLLSLYPVPTGITEVERDDYLRFVNRMAREYAQEDLYAMDPAEAVYRIGMKIEAIGGATCAA